MDVSNSKALGGSLQISTDVIAKIARLATVEIEGVKGLAEPESGVQGFFKRMAAQKPILVELSEDIAEITVNIVVEYGCKIPPLCEKVQENVKTSVQNMTSITVSKVNVIVAAVAEDQPLPEPGEEPEPTDE